MRKSEIKVSVVVPIYNVEKYLEKCLKSLVAQTIDSIEILLINDGSKDDSGKIAQQFANEYENVYYFEKENGGLSDARNYGIPKCKGEYIGFIDSDDYVDPDMFEKMYQEAKSKNADIVSCDYLVEYPDHSKTVHGRISTDIEDRFFEMKAAAWNKIYRAEWLKQLGILFPKGLVYEDTAFFCQLIPYMKTIGYVASPFLHYVQRNNSIANSQGKKNAQIFDIFDLIIGFYKEKALYETYCTGLEFACMRVLLGSSLIRMGGITDLSLRKEMVKRTFEYLKSNFPNWRKNPYISKSKFHYRVYFNIIHRYNALLLIKFIR